MSQPTLADQEDSSLIDESADLGICCSLGTSQPRGAPTSGAPIIKTLGTYPPMIHMLRHTYFTNSCNNIFVLIVESYVSEMYTEKTFEIHPDVEMRPDDDMLPDEEMHPEVKMHPDVRMLPDVSSSRCFMMSRYIQMRKYIMRSICILMSIYIPSSVYHTPRARYAPRTRHASQQ